MIPGVTVTVIDAGTNARKETVTDERGAFIVPHLPPGMYRVEAALQGFKSFIRSAVPLAVQQQFRLDVVLEIGQMAEAVDVVANASVLDTTTSSVGKVVDNARIQALPLNTRNIYGLIYLTPGVAGGIGNSHNQVGYSVNGVRGGLMETLVDGSSAAFPTVNGFHGISVFPSVDAVQEFKVQGETTVRSSAAASAACSTSSTNPVRTHSTARPTSFTGTRSSTRTPTSTKCAVSRWPTSRAASSGA